MFLKKTGRPALGFALGHWGLDDQDLKKLSGRLSEIFEFEIERYIYHELGELQDKVFDRKIWQELVSSFAHTPIDLLTRAVKDLLADTNDYGTLKHIIQGRRSASLGFYVAFLEGIRKELFPELIPAFRQFLDTMDWTLIEEANRAGFRRAEEYARFISQVYKKGKEIQDLDWAQREIETRLLKPLGIEKKSD